MCWLYLGRKGVALDAVLRSVRIVGAVVQKDFLDLVAVGQRAGRNVDGQRMFRAGVGTKDERLSRVMQHSRDLLSINKRKTNGRHQETVIVNGLVA